MSSADEKNKAMQNYPSTLVSVSTEGFKDQFNRDIEKTNNYEDIKRQSLTSSESSWFEQKSQGKYMAIRKYFIAGIFSVIAVIIIILTGLVIYLLLRTSFEDVNTQFPVTDTNNLTISTEFTTSTSIISETMLNIFSRSEWGAENPKKELTSLSLPIRRIIIAHTADDNASCFDSNQCKLRVKKIQEDNLELDDIPYNFLIGGDGSIFEGRGIEFKGQHTSNVNGSSYDEIGICVAFIGTFENISPSTKQIEAFHDLIKHFTDEGSITEDHKIFFHDQLAKPAIPANSLFETMKTFKKFYPVIKIYRRDEWKAVPPSESLKIFNAPVNRWIISHTLSAKCSSLESCFTSVRNIQILHKDSFSDIGYNFLIGSDDGLVFEGRGFNYVGAHTLNQNFDSLGISFIGNFQDNPPSEGMINAALKLFDDAVALGKVTEDYRINAMSDFRPTTAPGKAFMEIIKTWSRYSKT